MSSISRERLVSVDAKFYFLGALGFLPACAKVMQSPAKRRKLYHIYRLPFTASADLKIPDWDKDYSSYPIPDSDQAAWG